MYIVFKCFYSTFFNFLVYTLRDCSIVRELSQVQKCTFNDDFRFRVKTYIITVFRRRDLRSDDRFAMKMSSIGQLPNQTLRLVDRNRLVVQRVRVKPDDKLKSITSETCSSQQNLVENVWDLSNDLDFNANSNVDDLMDLGNTQMSSFFREFSSGSSQDQWKEEKQNAASNYKTVRGLGFYCCDSCPFLCLNVKSFLEHKEKDHHFHHAPLKSLLRTKCIGCDNIFYSINVLQVSKSTRIFHFLIIACEWFAAIPNEHFMSIEPLTGDKILDLNYYIIHILHSSII